MEYSAPSRKKLFLNILCNSNANVPLLITSIHQRSIGNVRAFSHSLFGKIVTQLTPQKTRFNSKASWREKMNELSELRVPSEVIFGEFHDPSGE